MAFTRTLLVLVGLSLTVFQATSGNNFRRLSNIPAGLRAQIDEFMSTNIEAQLALDAVRQASREPFQYPLKPYKCDCESVCEAEENDVTSPATIPVGASSCVILFPSDLATTTCTNTDVACDGLKTCGAPPPATCQAVGGGLVEVFSICVFPTVPFLSFEISTEPITTNCCCYET